MTDPLDLRIRQLMHSIDDLAPAAQPWETIVAIVEDRATGDGEPLGQSASAAPDPPRSTATSIHEPVEPDEWDAHEGPDDDLTIEYLVPRDETEPPAGQKRRIGAVVAVAAAILVAVGVVVVTDGNRGEVVTDPASSSSFADPVPLPSVTDPVPTPRVIDPVSGFIWTGPVFPRGETILGREESPVMLSVTAGGPGFVAVGSGFDWWGDRSYAAVWTSVDGVTWSRAPHDETVFGASRMQSVTAGRSGLVAVGTDWSDGESENAVVWTSVDGLTWSRVPHDELVFGGASMFSVITGGPGLVAVGFSTGHDFPDDTETEDGTDAAVWTSVDGLIWARVPHDEAVFGGTDNEAMFGVTVGGPGLVAVGWDGGHEPGYSTRMDAAVWTSVDGLTWSRVPHDEAVFGGIDMPAMVDVTVGGPGLVAVGFGVGSMVWTSVDGLIWSRVPHDEAVFGSAEMKAVTAGGPGLVAVGGTGTGSDAVVWTSDDGLTWSRVPDAETVFGLSGMNDVIVKGPGLMSVGSADGDAAVWVAAVED